MSRFVSLRKNKNGDVILSFNFEVIGAWLASSLTWILVSLFQFLETIYQKKILLGLAGLGLGFGFTLIVGQRPSLGWATNSTVINARLVDIEKVSLPQLFEEIKVNRGEVTKPVCLSNTAQQLSGSLVETRRPIVLSGCQTQPVYAKLENLNLGDEVMLTGINHGQYRYRIIEIKETNTDGLNTLIGQSGRAAIIFTPTNIWETQFLVIVAKP